jgi:hypothetical protein
MGKRSEKKQSIFGNIPIFDANLTQNITFSNPKLLKFGKNKLLKRKKRKKKPLYCLKLKEMLNKNEPGFVLEIFSFRKRKKMKTS